MTPSPMLKEQERFTYADYLTWPDEERWELIDGIAYPWNGIHAMSPGPGKRHQSVSFEIARQLGNYFKGRKCRAFTAPFDVRFSEQQDASDNFIDTVVQPDILVVCDKDKLDERGCNGVPDFIIEISSPSTGKNDLTLKFDLYQRYGVKEYWIIHAEEQTVMVFKIGGDGIYGKPDRYAGDGKVFVPLFGDLVIDLNEVFAE
jgi:Uma2 family endonuclease